MYNSHSFLTEHAFLIAAAATETMAPLTFRAPWGHCTTQRIQETHSFPSVFCGASRLIAWAGHWAAHTPHRIHSFPALGTKPAPPAIGRDSDQYQVLLLKSTISQRRVCQVYGLYTWPPRVGDRFRGPHGPPGGAENQLYTIHKGPSSCNV